MHNPDVERVIKEKVLRPHLDGVIKQVPQCTEHTDRTGSIRQPPNEEITTIPNTVTHRGDTQRNDQSARSPTESKLARQNLLALSSAQ